jgi:lariat debranching enzyme
MIYGVLGDVHGEHWRAIGLIQNWRAKSGQKLDFVLQVGDFEPHRNEADLQTMAAPQKYRVMGDFAQVLQCGSYPVPLYFIGGNHEPYGFLETLPDGAAIGANCHYLGRAGVREVNGLRVAFLSGVWQSELFYSHRPDAAQFPFRSNKEWIGWNEGDIQRLLAVGRADILLMHEWPPIFNSHDGMEWLELIIEAVQPSRIFCGHAHFRWSGAFALRKNIIPVECLGKVEDGRGAFEVWNTDK